MWLALSLSCYTSPREICRNIWPENIASHAWRSPGRQAASVSALATLVECSTLKVSSTVWWTDSGSGPTIISGAQMSSEDDELGS